MLLLLNIDADKKRQFSFFLDELSEEVNQAILKNYFEETIAIYKRIPITNFIALLIYGKAAQSSLKQFTGLDEKEEISLTDIAVMILHDLMAGHLIPKSK